MHHEKWRERERERNEKLKKHHTDITAIIHYPREDLEGSERERGTQIQKVSLRIKGWKQQFKEAITMQ